MSQTYKSLYPDHYEDENGRDNHVPPTQLAAGLPAFPVPTTIPILNWKIIDTLQGACFEFPDGRHSWPEPRERQIIEAFQQQAAPAHATVKGLVVAVQEMRHYIDGNAPDSSIRTRMLNIADAAIHNYELASGREGE